MLRGVCPCALAVLPLFLEPARFIIVSAEEGNHTTSQETQDSAQSVRTTTNRVFLEAITTTKEHIEKATQEQDAENVHTEAATGSSSTKPPSTSNISFVLDSSTADEHGTASDASKGIEGETSSAVDEGEILGERSSNRNWIFVNKCWSPRFVPRELVLDQAYWVPTSKFNMSAGNEILATVDNEFVQWDATMELSSPTGDLWASARKDVKGNMTFFDCKGRPIAKFKPQTNWSWFGPPRYDIFDAEDTKIGTIQEVSVKWSSGVPMTAIVEDLRGDRMSILSQERNWKNVHTRVLTVDQHFNSSDSSADPRMDPRVLGLYSALQFGARTAVVGLSWIIALLPILCCFFCCCACVITKCCHHSTSAQERRRVAAATAARRDERRREEEDCLMTRPVLDDGYESDQGEGKSIFGGCCSNKKKPYHPGLPIAPI